MRACAPLAALLLAEPAAAACKLALVLGLDVSSSVDAREYGLQLGGLAAAFRDAEVRDAILEPRGLGVAVYAFEWSNRFHQHRIAGWSFLDSPADIDRFAAALEGHRRTRDNGSTAIGDALLHAARRFETAPPCQRRTIDLSGDGVSNQGPRPGAVADGGTLDGITVNGLAVESGNPGVVIHYLTQVRHGEDSFVEVVGSFDDYPPAIRAKLLREIGQPFMLGELE